MSSVGSAPPLTAFGLPDSLEPQATSIDAVQTSTATRRDHRPVAHPTALELDMRSGAPSSLPLVRPYARLGAEVNRGVRELIAAARYGPVLHFAA